MTKWIIPVSLTNIYIGFFLDLPFLWALTLENLQL